LEQKIPNSCKLAETSDFDPILGPEVENLNTITEFFNFFVDDYIIDKIVYCTGPEVENLNTITEFFNFFVDDYIIDKIVYCTNKRLNIS